MQQTSVRRLWLHKYEEKGGIILMPAPPVPPMQLLWKCGPHTALKVNEKQTLNSITSHSLVTASVMEQQMPFDGVMDVYLCTHFDPCSIRKATVDLHCLLGATTELHYLRSFILASDPDEA